MKISRLPLPDICPLCGSSVDLLHELTCAYSELKKGKKDRHNELRDALISAFTMWGLPVDKQPKIRSEGDLYGDLQLPHPTGSTVVDTAVVPPQ